MYHYETFIRHTLRVLTRQELWWAMHFRTSLSSHSRFSQFQHSWWQPRDETEVSISSNNLDSSRNQSSTLLWDTKCPNCSVSVPKVSFSPPFTPLFRCPVTTAAESCEEQCDGSPSVTCKPKTSLLQLGSPFQMRITTSLQTRRERKRGFESNPERSFLSCHL